jgi:hypothetical protein
MNDVDLDVKSRIGTRLVRNGGSVTMGLHKASNQLPARVESVDLV